MNMGRNHYETLQAHGLRATPQRLAVAELLLSKPQHMTPQQVLETLKGELPSLSHNTIYLTLTSFEESGLLRKLQIDGKSYFDSNVAMHDHMYCSRCGRIEDIVSSDKSAVPADTHGWILDHDTRIWHGLCPECIKSNH